MSKYYIANENGEWWTVNAYTGAGQRVFVISETELLQAVEEESPEDKGADLATIDGLAGMIISNGSSVKIDLLV